MSPGPNFKDEEGSAVCRGYAGRDEKREKRLGNGCAGAWPDRTTIEGFLAPCAVKVNSCHFSNASGLPGDKMGSRSQKYSRGLFLDQHRQHNHTQTTEQVFTSFFRLVSTGPPRTAVMQSAWHGLRSGPAHTFLSHASHTQRLAKDTSQSSENIPPQAHKTGENIKRECTTHCAMKDFVISVLEDALSNQQDQIEALLAAQSNTFQVTAENAQLKQNNAILQKRLEKAKADVHAETKSASQSAARAQKSEKDLIALQHHIAQALDTINFQQTLIQHV
ncbi:hypothetical protein C8R47DRAFT_1200817 [Mycena vitilis]|nr:hypothetical protein C8R47DRAFT_1200817 [Mycena vitilis]